MSGAIDVLLIASGLYHDIDFARRELLALLAEHERVRVHVSDVYDASAIARVDAIVTYTCGVVPDDNGITALQAFLQRGRKWFALHGTNSTLEFLPDNRVRCPPLPRPFYEMLGSQFMAHPPIGRYKVKQVKGGEALVDGIGDFHVEDEHYLQDYLPGNVPLLTTRFSGKTSLFERDTWPDEDHLVMYRRPSHGGEVLYLTLGHARGRYDMRPLAEVYPLVERGAWVLPVFAELLRRGIRWSVAGL